MTAYSCRGDYSALNRAINSYPTRRSSDLVKYLDHETRIKDPHRCALITARTASNWRGRKERGGYEREGQRYASDVTDGEWGRMERSEERRVGKEGRGGGAKARSRRQITVAG